LWLGAHQTDGLSIWSRYAELCDLRTFLMYVMNQGQPVDPNFSTLLPKHLTPVECGRLVQTLWTETAAETLPTLEVQAWFFT
jgi:hypothetical protein